MLIKTEILKKPKKTHLKKPMGFFKKLGFFTNRYISPVKIAKLSLSWGIHTFKVLKRPKYCPNGWHLYGTCTMILITDSHDDCYLLYDTVYAV